MIPPSMFIPAAEESDLILELDRWVVKEVVRWKKRWGLAVDDVKIHFNLSARSFTKGNLQEIRTLIENAGIQPESLCAEITETAIMDDLDIAYENVRALRELGCHVALDDFGTGFSSLTHLATFPLDVLKLEGSFVKNIDEDPVKQTIVRSIVSMAKELGLLVVAEGVETPAELGFVTEAAQ